MVWLESIKTIKISPVKTSRYTVNLFWEFWKQEYLLSLRETSPLRHKGIHSQLNRQPRLGEVVIVKDDYLPRRV